MKNEMQIVKKGFLLMLFLIFLFETVDSQQIWTHGRLKASENGHFLVFDDGSPFFWLGDTGWELFHRLNRNEAVSYLKKRKEQGFNVIQAVLLSELDGLSVPNAYGSLPLIGSDPTKLNITFGNDTTKAGEYDYWDHVDYIIKKAEELGIFIGLLPCWGEYVIPREGRAIFNTVTQAYTYGNILGKRYHLQRNIIWILGGDRLPDERSNGIELWRAMAKGIADGTNGVNDLNCKTDYSTTLMSYHCFASSSQWFQNDTWLDFNMWGSYHSDFSITRAFEQPLADWTLPNPKPTLNSEPAYEEHAVNWLRNNGNFTSYDVRQIAYWSVFAGAFGHTYGCNPVWQFYDKNREPITFVNKYWMDALNDEGANQLKYLKNLIESRPMLERIPDQSIIVNVIGTGSNHCAASRGKNYIFVYIPTGYPVTIQMGKISGDSVIANWYNPRTGEMKKIGEYRNSGEMEFTPDGISKELNWLKTGRGCDWVLVLDELKDKK
jgi:Protein of unknown function (DUF4038)/Putative collagen-binding domain of a collagenase